MEESTINVVSYNILSSSLSKPSYHCNSPPETLDNTVRLAKLFTKLEAEIKRKSVITLQEVSERWGNELTVFFLRRDYVATHRFYGSDFNGYMGVLIAFPREDYSLDLVVSRRISDTVYWPEDCRHEKLNNRNYSNKTMKTLEGAERRWNCVLINQLMCRDSKKSFVIGTYHMPCMFRDTKFMDVHAGLLVRFVQETAKGLPTILSGDFNSHITSSAYQMITTGRPDSLLESLFHNHKDPKRISFGEDINAANSFRRMKKKGKKKKKKDMTVLPPEQLKRHSGVGAFTKISPMTSAYKMFLKEDPALTNVSNRTKDPKGGFASCIDYIFVTDEFNTVDVEELYQSREEITSPSFPDEREPSDHIMLRVTLTL